MNQALVTAGAQAGIRVPPYLLPPNLLSQDFESGTLPSGWSSVAGAPNYGYPSPPDPQLGKLNSHFCMALPAANDHAKGTIAATGDIRVYFQWQQLSECNIDCRMFSIEDGTTYALKVDWNASNKRLSISDTAAAHTSFPTVPVAVNTWYNVWLHYTVGSGANAVLSIGFDTSLKEPTSGTANYAEILNGASTITPDRIVAWNGNGGGAVYLFDRVGVSTLTMANGW